MHVRLNQFAAQPLVQLRPRVGVVSVVSGAVGIVRSGAPKRAVSAEISSAVPAICHYLMINPSVSCGGPLSDYCMTRAIVSNRERKA